MKEIKATVAEKHRLGNRGESEILTTFRNFWIIKILMQGFESVVFQPNPLLQQ